jgi:hypothetical protein
MIFHKSVAHASIQRFAAFLILESDKKDVRHDKRMGQTLQNDNGTDEALGEASRIQDATTTSKADLKMNKKNMLLNVPLAHAGDVATSLQELLLYNEEQKLSLPLKQLKL